MYKCIDCKYNINDVCSTGHNTQKYRGRLDTNTPECKSYVCVEALPIKTLDDDIKRIQCKVDNKDAVYEEKAVSFRMFRNKGNKDEVVVCMDNAKVKIPISMLKFFLRNNLSSVSTVIKAEVYNV